MRAPTPGGVCADFGSSPGSSSSSSRRAGRQEERGSEKSFCSDMIRQTVRGRHRLSNEKEPRDFGTPREYAGPSRVTDAGSADDRIALAGRRWVRSPASAATRDPPCAEAAGAENTIIITRRCPGYLRSAAEVEVGAENADQDQAGRRYLAPIPAGIGLRFVFLRGRAERQSLDAGVIRVRSKITDRHHDDC